MKIGIKTLIIFVATSFYTCEDVVEIEAPTAASRLVIEASIDWKKDTMGNNQSIILSTTTPYFDTITSTPATGAMVLVTNTNTDEEFVFVDQNDGVYTTNSFVPILNNTYSLEIIFNNETFTATETLIEVPDINAITQSLDGGFDPELLEVNVFFDDPEDEENYYLIRFFEEGDFFPSFFYIKDEFINGNEIKSFFEKEDEPDNSEAPFMTGDVVDINLYGISERYYNYMRLIIEQYYNNDGPFSTTPVDIRGNCVNQTNADNYPYGYFRVVQEVETSYTFQ